MKSVYQINHFTTVETLGDDELLAKSILLSTFFEAAGRLIVDQSSFKIKKARWDIYRSPGSSLNGGSEIPGLTGIEAYLNSGGALSRINWTGSRRTA
ncbi:MAG: hypothetical protein A4E53_02823 [Pelotomaculum sp. PtaB.Bin104]|nr:MAG: hypothetical protein A4E53_02823 [Pelotomaculum sp. PtaB.Bin104]